MNDTPAPAGTPTSRPRIALIAAVASNGVIGNDNRLPWSLPDDLKHFRTLTTGHAIIMGRKTWDSIRRPLPARQNIVVSRQLHFVAPGCEVAHTLEDAIGLATLPEPVFVIGGEALYRAAMPVADLIYLTEIERAFDGGARFPAFDRDQWCEVERETRQLDGRGGFTYHFATYRRSTTIL